MQSEDSIVPYHAKDLTGKKVLVLAPHPDDETLGCGGSLALHYMANDPVKVIFLTNGAMGDSSGRIGKGDYAALRRKEAVNACACLGISDIEFWAYEDRSLSGARGVLSQMTDLLEKYRPELVYVTSPLEFHPDHRALAFLLQDAVKGCDVNFEVAFCEITQPLFSNTLVDITPVLDIKKSAIGAYASQLKERPYGDVCLALNRFRSLTLPEKMTHAESYSLWNTDDVRELGVLSIPFLNPRRFAPKPGLSGPLVSIIVRTKDRPGLLANALASIANQTYANLEIIVVNDGGQNVENILKKSAGDIPFAYVGHEFSKGRAFAANSGLKASRGVYVNFLDDDDILYPNHVALLVDHIHTVGTKVAYSTVKNVYFSGPVEHPESIEKEEILFNRDFDPDYLLFANYMPIMSVLFSREVLDRVDKFDESMDLFEDWDFWVRVSRHFPFSHLDEVTAEYRFYGVSHIAESHHKKYGYSEAQALMFEHIRPFLNGRIWVDFVKNDLEYREMLNEKENALKELTLRLDEARAKTKRLNEELIFYKCESGKANTDLAYYRGQCELKERRLDEILSSKGWCLLKMLRSVKSKLLKT